MDNSVSDYERKYKVYYGRRRAGNPLAVSRKRTENIQERLQKIEQSVNGTPLKSPATEEKESGLFAWQKKK